MADTATAPETVTDVPVSGGEEVAASQESLKKEDTLRFGPNVKTRTIASYPLDKIIAPDGFNIRTAKGQVIAGIRVEKDMRNIPGMVDSIRQLDGITDPLTLSEHENGETILLQGYRRLNAALTIIRETPESPLALKLANVPVTIYSGLSPAQERQLVNDQRSKSFSALEVYRWYCEQLDGGFDWMNILRRCYHEIGNVTGSAEIVRKIDGIEDAKERDKELRKWATSYVFQWWVNSWKARPILRNMTEHTYLFKEKGTSVRPRVMLTSMRMRALWKEAEADMKAGEFDRQTGHGPRLESKLAFFEAEDNGLYNADGTRKNAAVNDGPKFRPLKEFTTFLQAHTDETGAATTLVGEVLGIAFKDGGAPAAVQEILNYEKCKDAFTDAGNLDPKLKAGLNLVFSGGEGAAEQFAAFLKDNQVKTPAERMAESTAQANSEIVSGKGRKSK